MFHVCVFRSLITTSLIYAQALFVFLSCLVTALTDEERPQGHSAAKSSNQSIDFVLPDCSIVWLLGSVTLLYPISYTMIIVCFILTIKLVEHQPGMGKV